MHDRQFLAGKDNADLLGEKLVNALGTREQSPLVTAEVTQLRQRVFTLFVNAWDQVRRAVSYLRWNDDDVDDIVPSLYAGRTRRKTDAPPAPPEPPAAEGGAATKTAVGGTTIAAAATSTAEGAEPKPAVTAEGAKGTPGSSPFAP